TLTLAIICLEKVGWATRCPSIESNVGQQVAQPTSYEQMQISNRTMLIFYPINKLFIQTLLPFLDDYRRLGSSTQESSFEELWL
ncbi:hypothetical protein KJ966_00415, partial [bacterium]|nr:hypothetical protein [bacterium]